MGITIYGVSLNNVKTANSLTWMRLLENRNRDITRIKLSQKKVTGLRQLVGLRGAPFFACTKFSVR